MTLSSLDNLAHIANMSEELHQLNTQLKAEEAAGYTPNAAGAYEPDAQPASTSGANGRPKRIACVNCRQQKSRCDSHQKHPAPCTRCAKKGLHCTLKSDYKRTYKRARIAQIEREFEELKERLKMASTPGSGAGVPLGTHEQIPPAHLAQTHPHRPSPVGVSPGNIRGSEASHPTSESNNSPEMPSIFRPLDHRSETPFHQTVLEEESLVCEEKTLDSVSLSPHTIRNLYLEFVDCYHPILPVVEVTKGPERIYRLCPALFWVIMFVSLRRFRDESQKTLLLELSPLIKNILSEITISPITRYNPTEEDEPIFNACSVYSVQAFLLYTFWPPITSSLSADSSWNTIGVALFQAIRIGLHTRAPNPDGTKTPQQIEMAQEQAKTWIVCNIVSQTIASSFGFPAFVQFDSSMSSLQPIVSTIQPAQIPKTLMFMTEIAQFEDQVAKTLNSNPMDPHGLIDATERLPLLKVLNRQLDDLEVKFANEAVDGFRKFQILTARVHLLTYHFMDTSRVASFELQKGLVRLYNAAISLVNHVHSCQTKDKRFVKYLPGVYILSIWQAAFIIGKLAHSPLQKVVDVGSGRQTYQTAITLAAKASVLKHDIAYRSSGIMKSMWQLFRSLDKRNISSWTISIRTRMSASVFFDCLYLLREKVGMIKLNNRTDGSGTNAEDEAISEEDDDFDGGTGSDKDTAPTEDQKSSKSTPSSTSSRSKKPRSLSNNMDAESTARKIIRTIPLDPQPMSVSKRSSIFNVVNNSTETSPHMRSEGSYQSPNQDQKTDHTMAPNATSGFAKQDPSPMYESLEHFDMDSLDISSSDLLWKDVDSVMNDFGFHT
jgi:transcriptional regulatory protein LEU3